MPHKPPRNTHVLSRVLINLVIRSPALCQFLLPESIAEGNEIMPAQVVKVPMRTLSSVVMLTSNSRAAQQ